MPEGCGPKPRKKWRPEGWVPQNSLFFPSPTAKFVLSSLSGSSRGIVAAVRGRGPRKVRVWASLGSFFFKKKTESGSGRGKKKKKESELLGGTEAGPSGGRAVLGKGGLVEGKAAKNEQEN